MNIRITTERDFVLAVFEHGNERVEAVGKTLTAAVENLVIRFKQLQEAALEELHAHGIIRVEPKDAMLGPEGLS